MSNVEKFRPWYRRCKICKTQMRTLSGSMPKVCCKCYLKWKQKQRRKEL